MRPEVGGSILLSPPLKNQDMGERYQGLTEAQEAVLVALSDQRCANLLSAADFIADLPDATKTFLLEARPEEIQKLQDGIRLAVATQTVARAGEWTMRVGRWVILTAFSIIMFFTIAWEKVPAFLKFNAKQ